MGYAVISTGGKQYKVREGDVVQVERVEGEVGAAVAFDNVLLYSESDELSIGTPMLENAVVKGHIVDQGKNPKIIVFKYKRRKGYRRKQGHRQPFTAVKIDRITV